ncbi:MAG: methionine gamma-lyase family protein [Clostridiales bacterium]|nr:methionine gamma-lyase family protein [Clostridiales bacterium]MCF8023272.1 methionine gamma-lyase family protein [Clostridiales bacterium]
MKSIDPYNINQLVQEAEDDVKSCFDKLEKISLHNQKRVLDAFRKYKVSDFHLKSSTGYGYNDTGRDTLENIYAEVFGTESALVRGQISSGTHAISLCLFGILRPGNRLLSVSGAPYDTLRKVIGVNGKTKGSIIDWGVKYEQVDVKKDGNLDWENIEHALETPVDMVMLQRSKGYSLREPLDVKTIRKIVNLVKRKQPEAVVFVDNCYGEFVEEIEPSMAGADLIAGSLIKNPGGGLAPTGGYVAGRSDLVEMCAARLTAPGIGGEVGASLGWQHMFFQGFFLAPSIVMQALKGAVLASRLFEKLGYKVFPLYNESRTDIVQAIITGSSKELIALCQAVQSVSPVDSYVLPEPWDMPGYEDDVIMAAGTFIQGASLELTADGPMRYPYVAYFQGGLTFEHAKIAVLEAAQKVIETRSSL